MKYTVTFIISLLFVVLIAGITNATPIYYTDISAGPELPLFNGSENGILDQLYGKNNLTRVDDSADQIWNFGSASLSAMAVAKYAGYHQNFGYIPQGGSFAPLFTVDNNIVPLAPPIENSATVVPGTNFVWALKPEQISQQWSSLQSQNSDDGFDHMVTWLISGSVGRNNTLGNYVIAWEDLSGGGDRDYNDLVVEVSGVAPVPEPATMLLFGTGLLGLAGLRLRKKK